MKINLNVAASLLMLLATGNYKLPKSATSNNRWHIDRAPAGSALEADRKAVAAMKRAARAAKRAPKP